MYFPSHDVSQKYYRVRIESFESNSLEILDDLLGLDPSERAHTNICPHEFKFHCSIYAGNRPLGMRQDVSHRSFSLQEDYTIAETLEFPSSYADLPKNAHLVLTVWGIAGNEEREIAGAKVPIFKRNGTLRVGNKRVRLSSRLDGQPELREKREKLERAMKGLRYIPMRQSSAQPGASTAWLDSLSSRALERLSQVEGNRVPLLYLNLYFPDFEHPVHFVEYVYPSACPSAPAAESTVSAPPFICDPAADLENLSEDLHYTLWSNRMDTEAARHNILTEKALQKIRSIINEPLIELYGIKMHDKRMLWTYRYSLSQLRTKALCGLMQAIDWSHEQRATEAQSVLQQWSPNPNDMDQLGDILRLLGPKFNMRPVREYAINCLSSASDEVLLLFLPQLVQSMRHDPPEPDRNLSRCAQFLIERAERSFDICNFLYWYMKIETTDEEDRESQEIYAHLIQVLNVRLSQTNMEYRRYLDWQEELLGEIDRLNEETAALERQEKLERLNHEFATPSFARLFHNRKIPFPLDPSQRVTGVRVNVERNDRHLVVFKSKLKPIVITFTTESRVDYKVVYKAGDDVRQDQLVQQVVRLSDRLLKAEHVDLKLTPYRVLATARSPPRGFIEFVPESHSVEHITAGSATIRDFFARENHDPASPLGFPTECLQVFVRSLAGYSVITYLLGVGDRHLDNLLVRPDGHFFHIDFGYFLWHDCKIFPAPMKLSKEIVACMGGVNSEYFNGFIQHAHMAYTTLRKYHHLLLSLFVLMRHAHIPDLNNDDQLTMMRDKFKVEYSDDEAYEHLLATIDNSNAKFWPGIFDRFHRIAQQFR